MPSNGNRWAHRSRDGCPVGYHQLRGLPPFSVSDGSLVSSRRILAAPANRNGWWTPSPSAGKRSTARQSWYSGPAPQARLRAS